jgi:hypothetical protein
MTPTYGGGYRFDSYGPSGNSWGTVSPTYGGGYRISRFGYEASFWAWPTRPSNAVVKETGRGANLVLIAFL